ncbi:MAG: OmpA family protein [Candidatus Hydrothermales bacterium]
MKKIILYILIISLSQMCAPRKAVKVEPVKEEAPPPPPTEVVEEPKKEEAPARPPLVLKTIYFDFDKYDIRPGDAEILKSNAELLKLYPEVSIVIEGHTCDIGTEEYNMGLGERRAKAARDYLIKLGIDPARISIVSYGETRLVDIKNKPINRRAEFKVKE